MQRRKNGILIENPEAKRKKYAERLAARKYNGSNKAKSKTRLLHTDYYKYKRYVTMIGFEDGHIVHSMVPEGHKEFRELKERGYQTVEKWERGDVS